MFCPIPGSLRFRLMESRPLDDESMRPNRQPALKYFEAFDFENSLVAAVCRVEVWWLMVVEIHSVS